MKDLWSKHGTLLSKKMRPNSVMFFHWEWFHKTSKGGKGGKGSSKGYSSYSYSMSYPPDPDCLNLDYALCVIYIVKLSDTSFQQQTDGSGKSKKKRRKKKKVGKKDDVDEEEENEEEKKKIWL